MRVLLADDDESIRRCLELGLVAQGFEVQVAADGAEALSLFQSRGPFDALLLDEDMPCLTGRQVLEQLRSSGQAVTALIYSGSLSLTPEEQRALGVDAVLPKPLSLERLGQAIRAALSQGSKAN